MQYFGLGTWPTRTLVSKSGDVQDVIENWSTLSGLLKDENRKAKTLLGRRDFVYQLSLHPNDVGRLDPRAISVHITYLDALGRR